jgi:hypothetical protein
MNGGRLIHGKNEKYWSIQRSDDLAAKRGSRWLSIDHTRLRKLAFVFACVGLIANCGGGSAGVGLGTGADAKEKAKLAASRSGQGTIANVACKADKSDLESSEYDTTGEGTPDVVKVFRRIGSGTTARLVLVCREADLNADGIKDVVRVYDDDGKPIREYSDRDFDGLIDEIAYFENGQVTHREIDSDANRVTDLKIFYDQGRPTRTERDISKRSTASHWQPDVWEYYEGGKIVRIGTDLNGDGRVDRWDRRDEYKQAAIAPAEDMEQKPTEKPSGSEATVKTPEG